MTCAGILLVHGLLIDGRPRLHLGCWGRRHRRPQPRWKSGASSPPPRPMEIQGSPLWQGSFDLLQERQG